MADFSIKTPNDIVYGLRHGAIESILENEYYALGELKNKKIGNGLQMVDYDYNISTCNCIFQQIRHC